MSDVSSVVLSFARADASDDPYAFRLGQQRYLLVSAGGGTQDAELDWDEGLLSDLVAIRRPGRDHAIVQRLGEKLRRFLASAGWPQLEARILEAVHARRRMVLSIRSAAAEIYSLPWELITLKSTGQHVGELPGVLLRYEWPDTQSAPSVEPPVRGSPPARILFAWSAAGGAVPAAEHLEAIRRACLDGGQPFSTDGDVIAHTTLSQLGQALAEAQRKGPPISVLHLLCHGHAADSNYGLALNAEGLDDLAAVDAGGLRRLLAPFVGMVRLVVLSACDSGNPGALGNHLGSVAQALHRIGISKVVASRYPLSVAGSIRLSEVLYRELLGGSGALESALLQLREALFRDSASLDWASVQLYSRAADGAFEPVSHVSRRDAAPIIAPARSEAAPPIARRSFRTAFAVGAACLLMGGGAVFVNHLRAVPVPVPAQPSAIVAPPSPSVALPPVAPAVPATPVVGTSPTEKPHATGISSRPAVARNKPPAATSGPGVSKNESLFNVVIRSESGSVVRVAGSSRTAARAQSGNQAQVRFQLAAGAHRVSCIDALTSRSTDVVVRVGEGEKNEADCFPP